MENLWSEELFWLLSRGQHLAAVLHAPHMVGRLPAVLMLHGFTGTKTETRRLFTRFARELATAGIVAMRFDFAGCGDSEGDFADVRLSDEVSDALFAMRYLEGRREVDPDRIDVLGMSMGGAVAALLMSHTNCVKRVVHWGSVADVERLARDKFPMRWNIRDAGRAIDASGNMVNPGFFSEMPDLHPLEAVKEFRGAALILHGGQDTKVPWTEGRDYFKAYGEPAGAGPREFHLIHGANHTFDQSECEAEVFARTLDWFRKL